MRIASSIAAFVLISTAGVSAQQRVVPKAHDAVPGGITEQGRGSETVVADRLRFYVRVFNNRPVPAGTGSSQPLMQSGDLQKLVVDAMHANGITDAHVVEAVLGNLSNSDQIAGTIAKPTRAKVADFERKVISALPSQALPLLSSVNVDGVLEADSCSAALDRARITAYRDARTRAEALAKAAGIQLGVLESANENDQTGGCGDLETPGPFETNGGAFNNPSNDGTFEISVNLSATFSTLP